MGPRLARSRLLLLPGGGGGGSRGLARAKAEKSRRLTFVGEGVSLPGSSPRTSERVESDEGVFGIPKGGGGGGGIDSFSLQGLHLHWPNKSQGGIFVLLVK